jgi:hypothetical protein
VAYLPKTVDVLGKHFQRRGHPKATAGRKQKVHFGGQVLERHHDEDLQKTDCLRLLFQRGTAQKVPKEQQRT